MAYDATVSRPYRIADGPLTGNAYARTIWGYVSADAGTTVDNAGYFTDGQDLGMKVNDLVIVTCTAGAGLITSHQVLSVSASDRSVSLSAGTTIGAAS